MHGQQNVIYIYTVEFKLRVSKTFSQNTKDYDENMVPSRSFVVEKMCENIPDEKTYATN
jgi:hypothetical protein